MTDPWVALIEGECASKSNARRAVVIRDRKGFRRLSFIKSDKALAFTKSAVQQLKIRRGREPPMEGDLEMECRIFYASRRPDLSAELIEDCLQKAGVILNDRQLKIKHLYWGLDEARPRVIVSLTKIEADA